MPGTLPHESIRPRLGDDQINGRGGIDRLDYRSTSGVSVDMVAGTATKFNGGGNDTFSNIKKLRGSFFNDTLQGDLGNNLIEVVSPH